MPNYLNKIIYLTEAQKDQLFANPTTTQTINGQEIRYNENDLYITNNTTADAATAFASAQSITLTGDVTGTASSTAGWSIATTLKNSGAAAGSYGPSAAATLSYRNSVNVPYITVDAKGIVTAISHKAISMNIAGAANTALVGQGTNADPSFVSINTTLASSTAATSSASEKLKVTVLGVASGEIELTKATTSVYGTTKLQDGIASTSTSLAATANAAYTASRNSLHTLATTTKYYVTGSTSNTTNTAGDSFDTGVYVTTTAGELSAVRHTLNVSGTDKAFMTYNSTDNSIDFIFN